MKRLLYTCITAVLLYGIYRYAEKIGDYSALGDEPYAEEISRSEEESSLIEGEAGFPEVTIPYEEFEIKIPIDHEDENIKVSSSLAQIEIIGRNEVIEYPSISMAADNDVANLINEQIYNAVVPEDFGEYYDGIGNTEIHYEAEVLDGELLSVHFYGFQSKWGSYAEFNMGMNFDLQTGKLLSLKDYCTLSDIGGIDNLISLFDSEEYIDRTDIFFIKDKYMYFIMPPAESMRQSSYVKMSLDDFSIYLYAKVLGQYEENTETIEFPSGEYATQEDIIRISQLDELKQEITEKDVNTYMLAKDYCGVDEFEDMDYYLFCDTMRNVDIGSTEYEPSIISSKTQTIEEARELYWEFWERLPLDLEKEDEEEKTNVSYVSPDCKWVVTDKWSNFSTINITTLFYEKEKVREKVSDMSKEFNRILVVKDGNGYREMDEAYYKKLEELKKISVLQERYSALWGLNAEANLIAGIKDDYSLLTIRKVADGTEQWSFPLQGIWEEVKKIRDDIQEKDTVMVVIHQFEGNEEEGWLTVQAGPSSFFRIAYPSGEVSYLGEYLYSLCFSPDGKYVAYSNVNYENGVDMDWEEEKRVPLPGIYIREVETGKTAYIYWNSFKKQEEDFGAYRDFIWIEKEAFEEYMQTGSKD